MRVHAVQVFTSSLSIPRLDILNSAVFGWVCLFVCLSVRDCMWATYLRKLWIIIIIKVTLNCLPIRERVKFKVACVVRQSLSGQASLYLADDCCLVSDSTRRSLRSADVLTCVMPRTRISYSDRTFAAAGPRLWNSLPVQLRNPDITYGLFRRQLKGHLFQQAWTRRSVTSDMSRLRKKTYLLTCLYDARQQTFMFWSCPLFLDTQTAERRPVKIIPEVWPGRSGKLH